MSQSGRDEPLPLVNRFQLAECLGVFHVTIAKWEREGLPVEERGVGKRASKYSLPAALKWFIAHERARYESVEGVSNLDAERAGLAREQRKRIEMQNAVRRGELLEVDVVTAAAGELLGTLRASLLALPAALAGILEATAREGGAPAVEALLRDRIEGALLELSQWRPAEGK